jgi:hypothetical protein
LRRLKRIAGAGLSSCTVAIFWSCTGVVVRPRLSGTFDVEDRGRERQKGPQRHWQTLSRCSMGEV